MVSNDPMLDYFGDEQGDEGGGQDDHGLAEPRMCPEVVGAASILGGRAEIAEKARVLSEDIFHGEGARPGFHVRACGG